MSQQSPKRMRWSQAAPEIQLTSPPESPERMRWSQAAPEIELTSPPPESPTTAMTQAVSPAAEATTQVVPQAGEPKSSVLDKLLGAAAPTAAPASLAGVAESKSDSDKARPDGAQWDKAIECDACNMWLNGPAQYQNHIQGKRHRQSMNTLREQGRCADVGIGIPPEGRGSAESGAQAAAPAAAAPVVPKGAAESEPIELPKTSPAGRPGLNPTEVLIEIKDEGDLVGRYNTSGELRFETEKHLETKGEEASASSSTSSGQAAAAAPGASAVPAAAALEEPKGEQRELPQDPDKVFEQVLLPKLQAGQPLDLAASLAEWVPGHLKRCLEATYDALKADCKTITSAYDSLSIYGLASHRPKEGVRRMLKVTGPDSKVCQAGSHASPPRKDWPLP